MRLLLGVFALSALLGIGASSQILAVCPMPTQSHANLFERLVKELVKKGHQVTYVSAFPLTKSVPNLTEITIPNLYDFLMEKMGMNKDENMFSSSKRQNKLMMIFGSVIMGPMLSETLLELPPIQELIKSNQHYDLVIGEAFLDESLLGGLSWKFKAPLISIAPFMPNYYVNYMVGNPAPAAYIPDPFVGYTSNMSFMERVWNTVFGFLSEITHGVIYMPKQDALFKKHFGEDAPHISDVIKNTSLVLVNHHYSLAFPRPYVPNMIEIGGYHVGPAKQLPQDLKKYFDESKDGVILFSLGSHLKSSQLPKEKRDILLEAFSELKQDVLWKFEDDSLTNLPKNVKISKWLPQSDILAHPNLKLFITHGGLLSTTEAVHRGVPLVGIPIAGDQPINMRQVENLGVGVTVQLQDLTKENLVRAVHEILDNPSYRENAKARSEYIRDTPLSAMDTATYWIEYVLRHKGAPHLRSAVQDLTWYQFYLLDVYAVLAIAGSLLLTVQFCTAKWILRKLFCKKNSSTPLAKKVN